MSAKRIPVTFLIGGAAALLVSLGRTQTVYVHGPILDIKPTPGLQRLCHFVSFPGGWRYQRRDESGGPLSFDDQADYEFRIEGRLGEWFLINGFEEIGLRYPARNYFRIKLSDPTAPATPATKADWEEATALPLVRKTVLRIAPQPLPSDAASFGGKRFEKTGAEWAVPSEYGSRLSPDSSWLVLQSETPREIPKTNPQSLIDHAALVYWDVFNAEAGEKMITIRGTYSGWPETASYELRRASWLTERYFIIPLGEHIERCLVCDFAKASRQGGKP